jgi:hypothetical protein
MNLSAESNKNLNLLDQNSGSQKESEQHKVQFNDGFELRGSKLNVSLSQEDVESARSGEPILPTLVAKDVKKMLYPYIQDKNPISLNDRELIDRHTKIFGYIPNLHSVTYMKTRLAKLKQLVTGDCTTKQKYLKEMYSLERDLVQRKRSLNLTESTKLGINYELKKKKSNDFLLTQQVDHARYDRLYHQQ